MGDVKGYFCMAAAAAFHDLTAKRLVDGAA
jgi:hypothetical protein